MLGGLPVAVRQGTPDTDLLIGGPGTDRLYGYGAADALIGLGGADLLDGGGGADWMDGGAGNDVYVVDDREDNVVEAAGAGYDTIRTALDWRLGANVEGLALLGTAISGTGNALDNGLVGNGLANLLSGGRGDDRLVGSDGADVLVGGPGDDIFYPGEDGRQYFFSGDEIPVDDGVDHIAGGGGSDTFALAEWYWASTAGGRQIEEGAVIDLRKGIVDYALEGLSRDRLTSIENVSSGCGDDTIIGTSGDNVLDAGDGYNIVRARGGDDIIVGGTSDGDRNGATVMERLDGGAGDDLIDSGGSYWERMLDYFYLRGLSTDLLTGGAGDDRLIGGAGHVHMDGGSGADVFEGRADTFIDKEAVSWAPKDAFAASVTIADFAPSEGDRIVLKPGINRIDRDGEHRGAMPEFVGATDDPGRDEVGYTVANGDTIIRYSYDFRHYQSQDGGPLEKDLVFEIRLENFTTPLSEDWIAFA